MRRQTDFQGACHGYERYLLSGEAGGSVYLSATQDRVVLEIQRGCIRGCRFCQAGNVIPPGAGTQPGGFERIMP